MTDWHRRIADCAPALSPAVADELAQHLADLYDEAKRDGQSDEDADALANAALTAAADALPRQVAAAQRSLHGTITSHLTNKAEPLPAGDGRFAMLTDLARDIRYSLRLLAAAPGFTLVVVLTLALGIGANAVVFSAVDALMLRGADAGDPARLVSVYVGAPDDQSRFGGFSYPDFADVRESGVVQDAAAYAGISLNLEAGGSVTAVTGELVSRNYFDVIQVPPARGRTFAPDEDDPGRPLRVVVIGDRLWRERLGADPNIPGLMMTLNGETFIVVGVMPPGFSSPILGRTPEFWLPSALQQEVRPPSAGLMRSLGTADLLGQRGPRWLSVLGRLHPSQTLEAAEAGLATQAERMRQAYPDTMGDSIFRLTALNEGPGLRQAVRPLLSMLSWTALAVLLIACTNVASLMIARAVTRRREMAVRLALGGRPQRLARQWLTESVVLALFGGAAGLCVAWLGIPLLYQVGFPTAVEVTLNGRVLLVALALSGATGVLFGLAPMTEALRRNTVSALRDEGGSVASGRRASMMRRGFVVAQVAIGLVLLVGALLFVSSMQNARGVDLGYQVTSTVLGGITLGAGVDEARGQTVYRDILERVRQLPGVDAAAYARVTVLSGGARTVPVAVGMPATPDTAEPARTNVVSDGYFTTLGIQLLRGRSFTGADTADAPAVAVVTPRMAEKFWPGADPVGREFFQGPSRLQVIGLVDDNVYVSALELDPLPVFYTPLSQNFESGVTLHVRTSGAAAPTTVVPSVRQAIRAVEPTLLFANVRTLEDEFDASLGDVRLMATLVGAFGTIAALLAAIGLYGVMAGATEQRRAEISVRLALGAEPRSILVLILRQGLTLVAIGTAIGLAAAFGLARFVESELFGISATNPATYAASALLLVVVALLACAIPARRAMQVEPIRALRGN